MRTSPNQSIFRIVLACSALLISVVGCSRAPQVPPKTVEITADDTMKFSINAFDVAPGQKVTVTLKNIGTSPKVSMGHDFVVLKKNVNVNAFLEAGFVDVVRPHTPGPGVYTYWDYTGLSFPKRKGMRIDFQLLGLLLS